MDATNAELYAELAMNAEPPHPNQSRQMSALPEPGSDAGLFLLKVSFFFFSAC